ncbi:MAG: hypothetical protein HOB32_10175 [Nitrospina sp.]|nr:hypothetical protein [Nitrospina sp.]
MESQTKILNFLNRVRRLHFYAHTLQGTYILLAYFTGAGLLGCLIGLSYKPADGWIIPAISFFCIGLVYIVYKYFIKILISPFSNDDAALLAESRYPEVNNSLINSYQLSKHLKDSHFKNTISLNLIKELHKRTSKELDQIDPALLISQSSIVFHRNWFFGILATLVLTVIFFPELLTKGYENWANPRILAKTEQDKMANQNQTKPKLGAVNYSIESLDLNFHFPSYTRKNSELIKNSKGIIHVLPGTEVNISAKTNTKINGGNLIFKGKDSFAMKKENSKYLKSSLLVKEGGFYQFKIKGSDGSEQLLAKKYPVTLVKDNPPNIILFLANPRPVYFLTDKVELFYEGSDDFGINTIDLVISINGTTERLPVKKNNNQEKMAKGSYTWSLAQMSINPGDEVNYYLEINDNDNIFGPNKGQSETYSFKIFDSGKELENLVEMQEDLVEKMIALLATGLVKGASLNNQPNNLIGWKELLTGNIDELIKIVSLTQKVYDRGKAIDQFPQKYLDLLKNITRGLSQIRKNQIKSLSNLQSQIHKPNQAILKLISPYAPANNEMTDHLEKDILFLVKMTNQQKITRAKTLEEELNDLTQKLREDLEKSNNEKISKNSKKLVDKIDELQKVLQKLMNQLSRQTNGTPDEFLNPDAFKRLNIEKLSDALKKMQNMVSRGKFEEAIEELKKMEEDLKLLANQIHRADSEKESFFDPETIKIIDSSIKKVDKLERRQQKLAESTTQINQELREQQSKAFENQIDKLFKGLLLDIDSIRSIFKEDEKFLASHKAMNQIKIFIDKEIEMKKKIKQLSQATVDFSGSEKLDQSFTNLKEARNKLSELIVKKSSLNLDEPQKFRETLPQILKKYDSLKKLAKLQDLNEFKDVFKQAYPNVLRWQYKIRTTPNLRNDISDKLEEDLARVSQINNSISKKIGSMVRSIRKNYSSSITRNQKKELKQMGKQEQQLQQEVQKLSKQFNELSKKNPMIPSELSQRMKKTARHMEQAATNLKEQNVRQSIESENQALKGLNETSDLLRQMKSSNGETKQAKRQNPRKLGTGSSPDSRRGSASRMKKEHVRLPDETQYKAPKEFREEILNAMKKQAPKNYERMIMEYYKDLVQ